MREQLLIRAIQAAAERLKEQRFRIADYIRLSELRNLVVAAEPKLVIAGWVSS